MTFCFIFVLDDFCRDVESECWIKCYSWYSGVVYEDLNSIDTSLANLEVVFSYIQSLIFCRLILSTLYMLEMLCPVPIIVHKILVSLLGVQGVCLVDRLTLMGRLLLPSCGLRISKFHVLMFARLE